jgi:type II secretory pathway component PulC
MKNKKLLYILIPGTLLIWGMIIYKIFNTVHAEENTVAQHAELITTDDEIKSDTFSIHPVYRDPFLRKKNKINNPGSGQAATKITKPKIVPVVIAWPKIIYSGIIKNQKSNKQLALIEINGQSNMMKVGEEVYGVQLLKVFKDSIEVGFLKEKKFVSKI